MSEKLLRVREAAQVLSKSEMWVYEAIRTGVLECVRLGRSIRIREIVIQKFIKKS